MFLRHYYITGISHTDSYIIYAYVTARLCNAWLSERKTDTPFPVANMKTNWRKNALNCKQRPCSLVKLPCLALWVRISCSQVQEGLANSQQPCALFEYTMINVVSISPEQLRTERVLATCNPGKSFLPKRSANIYQTLATTFLDALVLLVSTIIARDGNVLLQSFLGWNFRNLFWDIVLALSNQTRRVWK